MMNVNDFTFKKETNLFGDPVLAVYRNRDKKHIISIGHEHQILVDMGEYDLDNHQDVLDFIQRFYPDLLSSGLPKKPEVKKETPASNQGELDFNSGS